MQKPVFLALILWWYSHAISGQTSGGLRWVLPMQEKLIPMGKSSARMTALKGDQLWLMGQDKKLMAIPYDSMTNEHHGFWKMWKNGFQGIYHEVKGELLPPVFERVSSCIKEENNWVFSVSKYGMNAVVNDQNKLLLPYQKYTYGNFIQINDTIVAYSGMGNSNASIDRLSYVSYHGEKITLPVARPFFPPEFQRVSADAYVLTQYHHGVITADTFPEAGKFEEGVALVRQDSLWGYLRRDGRWMIKPKFNAATAFGKARFAVVKSNGKFGAVNLAGEFVVQPQYDALKVSVPGYFEFKIDGNIGLLDSTGNIVIAPGYYSKFERVGSQCVSAKSGDSLLIFRHDGTLLNKDKVRDIKDIKGEENFLCQIETGGKERRDRKVLWGFMSPEGKWIINPVSYGTVVERKQFVLIETKSDPCCQIAGLQYQESPRNQYFLFDWKGKPYLHYPVVTSYTLPDDRFLIFDRASQFGIITHLHQLIEPMYDELVSLGNGWVKARIGDRWGLLHWENE